MLVENAHLKSNRIHTLRVPIVRRAAWGTSFQAALDLLSVIDPSCPRSRILGVQGQCAGAGTVLVSSYSPQRGQHRREQSVGDGAGGFPTVGGYQDKRDIWLRAAWMHPQQLHTVSLLATTPPPHYWRIPKSNAWKVLCSSASSPSRQASELEDGHFCITFRSPVSFHLCQRR